MDYRIQKGLNANIPGIQNSLHVVETFVKYSIW